MTTESTYAQPDISSAGTTFSPVRLSYVAALRGIVPHTPKTAFAWGQIGCGDIDAFLGLAASNPEGRFFAVVTESTFCDRGQKQADLRHVSNASFLTKTEVLRDLDYLVCNASETGLSRDQLATLAETALKPNGLLVYRYRAYPNADENLRFLTNEFSAEMNTEEAKAFLHEVKALGTRYFETHPIAAAALEKAMTQNMPESFFATCSEGPKATSGTFETMVAFAPRGLVYVGDAEVYQNYMELAAPAASHETLVACQSSILYEPIKDFAIQRLERTDIWCRTPVTQTANLSELFNDFTFGILADKKTIENRVAVLGQAVDFSIEPYAGLLGLMETMPICIGDFLHHVVGTGVDPAEAVAAINTMVALGVVSPMRSSYQGQQAAVMAYPKWETGFNRYLNDSLVTTSEVMLASPVVGAAVKVPVRDALVIQAINRVGMKDSVGALIAELERVANDPVLSAEVLGGSTSIPETAHKMVLEVVNRSMVQWYAYGLLAA